MVRALFLHQSRRTRVLRQLRGSAQEQEEETMKLRVVLVLLFLSSIASAALLSAATIKGIVVNETTGKPQAGVPVQLMKLEQGMVPIGDTKSGPDGSFSFEAPPPPADIPYLLRGDYQGVAYHGAARDATTEIHLKV